MEGDRRESSMRFRARMAFRFGPFYATVNQSGRRTYGLKLGRFSHNFTHRTTRIDTPGPGGFVHRHGRRGQR
jgi:hypothetical protein